MTIKYFGGILQIGFAYAIMPVGKKTRIVHVGRQQKAPERHLWGFFIPDFGNGRA